MKRTLLVVDDAMIIREIIKQVARTAEWEIAAEAGNGQEAVERYDEFRPDAVTLDLVMPKYDGLHGLRGIMEADSAAKVVVVSALEQKNVFREAFQIGAADFLIKPFDRDTLCNTLDKLVPQDVPAGNAL